MTHDNGRELLDSAARGLIEMAQGLRRIGRSQPTHLMAAMALACTVDSIVAVTNAALTDYAERGLLTADDLARLEEARAIIKTTTNEALADEIKRRQTT